MNVIENFPNYCVDEESRVYNIKYERELKGRVCLPSGYIYLSLRHIDGNFRNVPLHRIVAKAFIPNPLGKPFVNHKDHNKLNNSIDNLEWVTNAENIQHAYDGGMIPKGQHRYNNVNPVEKIYQVCDLLQEGLYGNKEIGEMLGVSPKTVQQIKARKQWKDVSGTYMW